MFVCLFKSDAKAEKKKVTGETMSVAAEAIPELKEAVEVMIFFFFFRGDFFPSASAGV